MGVLPQREKGALGEVDTGLGGTPLNHHSKARDTVDWKGGWRPCGGVVQEGELQGAYEARKTLQ